MTNYNKVFSVKIYNFYYWIQRIIAWFLYKVIFDTSIEGQENIDFSRTFLIIANHNSYIDPPLVGYAVPKPIAYMAKEELFKVPILNKIIRWSGAYSVNRKNKDNSFIQNTIYALENGWLVTIFPEGGRSLDGRMMNVKSGVARILTTYNVPVLPVALIGTNNAWGKGQKFKFRTKMKVIIGKPIYPEEYLPIDDTSDDMNEAEKIEHIRKIYADRLNRLLPDNQKALLT